MLTVIETCQQQARSVFQFLTTTVEARFANQSAPSPLTRLRVVKDYLNGIHSVLIPERREIKAMVL